MENIISIFSLLLVSPGEGSPARIEELVPAFCKNSVIDYACLVTTENCGEIAFLLNEDKNDGVYYTCIRITQEKAKELFR